MLQHMLVTGFECSNVANPETVTKITDFSSASACTDALLAVLAEKPGNFVSVYIELYKELENAHPWDEIIIRYAFTGDPNILMCSIMDYEGVSLTQGFFISINRETRKLGGLRSDGRSDDDAKDEVIKIIKEYGMHIDSGVRWSAFLLHQYLSGNLDNYFSEERYMEIH
jgi:hypothetical protein